MAFAHFPQAATPLELSAVRTDDARLAPGVRAILGRYGLASEATTRFADGSLPVYAVGAAHVLKLYPPCFAHEFAIERSSLLAVEGRLPIPTPRVIACGEFDGWAYLLMSRLHGVSLADAWPRVPIEDRDALIEVVGHALAAFHALPTDGLTIPRPHWPTFVAEQTTSAVARQRENGLAPHWLEQLDDFLRDVVRMPDAPGVLLHTEVMREHLLVEETANGWRLSGLFDFEPSMVGAADYEFASVGLFVTCGERGLLCRLMRAYGVPEGELNEFRSRQLLAYALLHRYSDLTWYLTRLPPRAGTRTLADLANQWFPLPA